MSRPLCVFDVDDILWGLNLNMSRDTGIDINKIIEYRTHTCPTLTPEEKRIVVDYYKDPENYRDMNFFKGAEEIMLLERLGAEVLISSNNTNEETRDLKIKNLHEKLKIPYDKMRMHLITDETCMSEKPLSRKPFILCDDAVHHIMTSKAKYNLMINYPWNSQEACLQMTKKQNIFRFDSLAALMKYAGLLLTARTND